MLKMTSEKAPLLNQKLNCCGDQSDKRIKKTFSQLSINSTTKNLLNEDEYEDVDDAFLDMQITASDSDIDFYNFIVSSNEELISDTNKIAKENVARSRSSIDNSIKELTAKMNHTSKELQHATKSRLTNVKMYEKEFEKLGKAEERELYKNVYKSKSIRLEIYIKALENKLLSYKTQLDHLLFLLLDRSKEEDTTANENTNKNSNKNNNNRESLDGVVPCEGQQSLSVDVFKWNNLTEFFLYMFIYIKFHLQLPANEEERKAYWTKMSGIGLFVLVMFLYLIIPVDCGDLFELVYDRIFPKPKPPPPHWLHAYVTSVWDSMLDYYYTLKSTFEGSN